MRSLQGNQNLRYNGFWLLKPCTRKLIGFLAHQDAKIRGEGAKALGKIGDPEAVRPLVEALLKEKQDEQMPLALAEIGDVSALDPLLDAFKDADREVRPNIALALGAFNDKKAVAALIEGLSDLDPNVRFCSISSLGRIRDSAAVSHLLGCLGENNEWIFLNVVDALARLGAHRATNPLVAFYLKERNERKRSAIITALGAIGDLTSVPTLSKALRDTDDRVKANAIESLARLGLPAEKALGLIQPFLKHPNNRVRGNAMIAAAGFGNIDLAPTMRSMLEDPDKWIRATLG
jgi:HEAT repeat protein